MSPKGKRQGNNNKKYKRKDILGFKDDVDELWAGYIEALAGINSSNAKNIGQRDF